MQIAQKIRENKLTLDERIELVKTAESALRRSGGSFTKFLWRGELLNYGLTSDGIYVINETDWGIVTKDPFTGAEPSAHEPQINSLATLNTKIERLRRALGIQ